MSDISILVLSGLPAAGKTLLTTKLRQHAKKDDAESSYLFVVIEYDQLMPDDVEKILIESEDSQCAWKTYRENILLCVDSVLSALQTSRTNIDNFELSPHPVEGVPQELWTTFRKLINTDLRDTNKNDKICFVIDDNMYYSSMRYKYYQLARKYTVGFCQIHVHTELGNAVQQNSQRHRKVNEDVIVTMASKMEVPDKLRNSWEEYSLIFTRDRTNIGEILDLILTSCKNPVQPVEEEDTEQKNLCRLVCSESFLHQSDQILRKLVSQEMVIAKDQFSSKAELKSFASFLQVCRKQLYNKLKSESVCAPKDLVAMVTDSSKDTSSDMFKLLQDLFKIELKEINR